ncbi:MAG: AraC family transcriptional regulator ligand-binding domain-containing protein [Bacteroidota bacterium]
MRQTVKLTTNWSLLLQELGAHPDNVLRRANLPISLLSREQVSITIEECFRFWESLEAELPDQPVPFLIGHQLKVEAFDPAIFAALSSPNFNQAALRLQKYKRLIGPFRLDLDINSKTTQLSIDSIGAQELPAGMGMLDLVFFVSFIRRATRAPIVPREITVVRKPKFLDKYRAFFECDLEEGPMYTVTFDAEDAAKPFLTANETMWDFFEPVLQQRLAAIEFEAAMADRVHAALCELLPSGRGSVQEVASMLGVSNRSLQRYLQKENTSFKRILNATREQLARHYLQKTQLTVGEIAFLLGFDEPNSFFRAFKGWTGTTPQRVRDMLTLN